MNNYINNYTDNNMNNNNVNYNNNLIYQNNNDDDEFNLHFRYKSKEVVLYINPNMNFHDIQNELLDNYETFRQIRIKGFSFNNQMINPDFTCKQLNIKSNSKIYIID